MKQFLRKLHNCILMLLVFCLAFGLIGGVVREDTESTASDIEIAATVEETTQTEIGSEETIASGEERIVEPKIAELAPVDREESENQISGHSCICNGTYAGSCMTAGDTQYVSVQDVFSTLEPNSVFSLENDCLSVQCGDIRLQAQVGEIYFTSNNRYLYAPAGVIMQDGEIYLPADCLAKCFGGTVEYDAENDCVNIYATDLVALEDGSTFYGEEDLYWLSRIIYAEANGESFEGMLAVGNVVINRLNSSKFSQNTIKGIIFATGQFEPVARGSIYRSPSDQAVLAARLALEGCEIVPETTTYFATGWLGEGFTIVTWIGNHCFMTI